MSYDSKCADLAEAFLDDVIDKIPSEEKKKELIAELAQQIQCVIEDFITYDVEGK